MASMPSINITVSVVINTFLIFALFSFGVFGAVMGLLWRPGRGTAERRIIRSEITECKKKRKDAINRKLR